MHRPCACRLVQSSFGSPQILFGVSRPGTRAGRTHLRHRLFASGQAQFHLGPVSTLAITRPTYKVMPTGGLTISTVTPRVGVTYFLLSKPQGFRPTMLSPPAASFWVGYQSRSLHHPVTPSAVEGGQVRQTATRENIAPNAAAGQVGGGGFLRPGGTVRLVWIWMRSRPAPNRFETASWDGSPAVLGLRESGTSHVGCARPVIVGIGYIHSHSLRVHEHCGAGYAH